ncbi:MAG: hypothetical protein AMXMBFR33_38300 [Candidatus Xenobia bacterium]
MSRRALTLLEILVSLSLLGVVGVLVLQIFLAVNRVSQYGGARIEVQNATRLAMRRLVPLIESAIPPASNQSAVTRPADGQTGRVLEFTSSIDHLGNAAPDPRNPVYLRFRIRHAGPELWLEQLGGGAPPPRLLGRLQQVEFTNLGGESVRIALRAEAQTRTLAGVTETVSSELTTQVYLPYHLHQAAQP